MAKDETKPIDRELARYLMRSSDAIDLLLAGMTEALHMRSPDDPMIKAAFQAVHEIHAGIRAPILKHYPEFDRDKDK